MSSPMTENGFWYDSTPEIKWSLGRNIKKLEFIGVDKR